MALSASLKIINNTGANIQLTHIHQINDDSTWAVPPIGTIVANGHNATIAMGNSSVFFAPKGCGCVVQFISEIICGKTQFGEIGQIYLDVPAVGAHTLNYSGSTYFHLAFTNPTGNSYVATITL